MVREQTTSRSVAEAGGSTLELDVLGALAAGRTTMVYLARDARGFFTWKRLHDGQTAAARAVFSHEAAHAAAVHHPNVVATRHIDGGDGGGHESRGHVARATRTSTARSSASFAMQFVEGTSVLRIQHVDRGERTMMTPVPTAVAATILLDLLAGLGGVHAAGLVHGDVAPGNVLVGTDGLTRLIDFGASVPAGGAAAESAALTTPGYASPEAVRGEPLTARADVFSAGVVLWELFSGRRLFAAPTPAMAARQILGGYIPDLSSVAPTVPPTIAAVCTRALARQPRDRFTSCDDFRTALESAARKIYGQVRHEAPAAFLRARCRPVIEAIRRMTVDVAAGSGTRPRVRPPE